MNCLKDLNEEQIKPVLHTEGAVMVSAGAGSGKTRVLTHRIAHLVLDEHVPPYNILAITFTNKAAREMKSRLESMLAGEADAGSMWVMTFHSMCVRILRANIDKIGYSRNFSIYAEDETERVIKAIIKELKIEKGDELFKTARYHISNAKSNALPPAEYEAALTYLNNVKDIMYIFNRYEAELKKNNALDFDDLLTVTYRLLCTRPDVLEHYQERFRYIHVDEFQDTNQIQYLLVKLLGGKYGNIMVVGDEDQSIYGWRGAKFSNIADFVKECKATLFKLERNYRSTKRILDAANSLIKHNESRVQKELWTEGNDGLKPVYYEAWDERQEAEYVAQEIKSLVRERDYSYDNFAVLMRINALSRAFEEKFLSYGIPYKIYGGFKFYERKEIKDVIAFLRAAVNPEDDEAVLRAVGVVSRGVGAATLARVKAYSYAENISMFKAVTTIDEGGELPNAIVKKMLPFKSIFLDVAEFAATQPPDVALINILRRSGINELYAEETEENISRRRNIDELSASLSEYCAANDGATLPEFLQGIALYSDMDSEDISRETVTIATVHSAKGLEFNTVFAVGLEDGIFPISRAKDIPEELEEERRLLYVAITRAKSRLYLTRASSRFMYGTRRVSLPSKFLFEVEGLAIPKEKEIVDDFGYGYYEGAYEKTRRESGGAGSSYSGSASGGYSGGGYSGGGYSGSYNSGGGYSGSYGSGSGYSGASNSGSYSGSSNSGGGSASGVAPVKPKLTLVKAADLAANKDTGFKVGDRVEHPKFGQGEITAIAEGNVATISFGGLGRKTLSLNFAPLKKV